MSEVVFSSTRPARPTRSYWGVQLVCISRGFMAYKMFLLFSTLMMITSFASADNDCKGNNCNNNGNYWVKIKRLSDIDLGEWKGEDFINGTSIVEKKEFCAISYLEGKKRTMYDPELELIPFSNGKSGQFVVTQGAEEIPITITLDEFSANDAPQALQEFKIGQSVTLAGDDNYDFCKENELKLTVTAYKDDIIRAGATGKYEGRFRMEVRPGTSPQPPAPVFINFSIELDITPSILISGLEDMPLTDGQGSGTNGFQDFCVFATNESPFKIKGQSTFGNGVFKLGNNDESIEYQLEVGLPNSGGGNKIILAEGGVFDGHSSWKGDDQLDCAGKENMRLTVTITEDQLQQAKPGLYHDTVTLTVAAQ